MAGGAGHAVLAPGLHTQHSAFRIGHTRKPPGFHTPHTRGEHFGFPGLDNGIGMALLLGQLTGVHHHKAQRFLDYPPVAILYSDLSRDALPPPTAGCLSLSAAWFLHQQRQWRLLLSPSFQCLSYGTGAGNQSHQAHPLFETQPDGPLTIGLTIRHNALDSFQPQREALLNGEWGLEAITRVAIADTHAQGQAAIATHA
jgi:hypothetical protein